MQRQWLPSTLTNRLLRQKHRASLHSMGQLYASQPQWIQGPSGSRTPAYRTFGKDIRKPESDDRDYRLIRLENGLQAMLVHDSTADKAAASLDVAVGHLDDPDDMPGLAHFCEHLLFMGTESFPRENEYSEFLAKNNGASNAYTSTSNTNYYFNVATPALSDALARFSAFFHCPLFSPSCTLRELNAVDSEHKKNHQSDLWRIFQLNKHLSKEDHVWRKFGTGHRESLSKAARDLKAKGLLKETNEEPSLTPPISPTSSLHPSRVPSPSSSVSSTGSDAEADGGSVGRETRRRLVEWWNAEYCAGRMRLCVIGKEPLDELAKMVSTLFSPIPNRRKDPLPMIEVHPVGPNEMGTLVAVQTIMSFHIVEITFPLGYQPHKWRYKPATFLAHLIGHEGPGSLHSYLKNKGWVTALSAGAQTLARGFGLFKITLHLTKDGFRNYQSVTLATFKYLSLLRSSSFPAWYQKEISMINETKFRFSEKMRPDSYAAWISDHMAWPVDRDLILAAPQLVWEWDEAGVGEKQVRDTLDTLTVDRGRVTIMARVEDLNDALSDRKNIKWEHEPWYGTGYVVEKFDQNLITQANGPNDIPELFLPGPNEFLPTNLDVHKKDVTETDKRPRLIRKTPLTELWYKKDDTFWVPKAQVLIDIRSPSSNVSPRASVMTRLFSDLVNDSLTEFSYDADLAGLSYNFASHSLGTHIAVSGYNDKLPVLTKHVLEKIKGLKIKQERLDITKEQLKRNWENFFLSQPFQISDYVSKCAMTEEVWLMNEKLLEIPSITVEELEKHINEFYSSIYLKILVVGNIYKDEAISIAEMSESILDASPAESSELVERSLILPQASNFVWTQAVPNSNEPNSSLTYYLHVGDRNDARLRVTSSLLIQILSEPAFNVLRTKEQLGYVVSCSSLVLSGGSQFGIRIRVQSERHPLYLEERVENFLHGMKGKLEEMEDSEFLEQKKGLERSWREGLKNLSEETSRYWTHIESGFLDFYRRSNNADLLEDVTKGEVLSLFLSHVHPSSATRAKLSIHLCSQKPQPKRVGFSALDELNAFIREQGFAIPEQWQEGLDDEPTMVTVVERLQSFMMGSSLDSLESLTKKVSALVDQFPAERDKQGTLGEGAVEVVDLKKFKASLRISEDPKPLVEWNDLPVSKI